MKKLLALFLFSLILISCENFSSEKSKPSFNQTVEYIGDKINGHRVDFGSFDVFNASFLINNKQVIYSFENTFQKSEHHYKITSRFSLNDIKYIRYPSFRNVKYIILNLTNKSNQELVVSLNSLPLPDYIDENKSSDEVVIYVEPSDFDGLKKAFENLIEIRNKELASDYFEE